MVIAYYMIVNDEITYNNNNDDVSCDKLIVSDESY